MSALAACALLALAVWARGVLRPARTPLPGPHAKAGRRRPPTAADWAGLLDRASAEVRTGAALSSALARAMDAGPVHGVVVRPGVPPAALAAAGPGVGAVAEAPDDEVLVAHALGTAHLLGGPVAATLDAAAAQLRERIALRAEAEVHSAQARLSARVLTAVPVVFCCWTVATSPTVRSAWFGPIGAVCAVIGGALNLAGWWWMRHLVARATP